MPRFCNLTHPLARHYTGGEIAASVFSLGLYPMLEMFLGLDAEMNLKNCLLFILCTLVQICTGALAGIVAGVVKGGLLLAHEEEQQGLAI